MSASDIQPLLGCIAGTKGALYADAFQVSCATNLILVVRQAMEVVMLVAAAALADLAGDEGYKSTGSRGEAEVCSS